MSKEQIDEMASILCPQYNNGNCIVYGKCEDNCSFREDYKRLYNAGYRKQSEGADLRVEITTDDFRNIKLAKERKLYRKRFFCPNCDLLIKTESWDGSINHMFGESTVLKDNSMPIFCPRCGAKMKGGAE